MTNRRMSMHARSASALRVGSLLSLSLLACGDTTPPSKAVARTGKPPAAECDMTPIDDKGTLPACAAGTSTEEGPGLPYNFTGVISESDVQAGDLATAQQAPMVAPAAQPELDPVDRGFAPAQ